jgi:glucose dehydrogenase
MKRWMWIPSVLFAASLAAQDRSARPVEWPYYGGDPGGTRHSTLTDINAGNVKQLQQAWQWKHWERRSRSTTRSPDNLKRRR